MPRAATAKPPALVLVSSSPSRSTAGASQRRGDDAKHAVTDTHSASGLPRSHSKSQQLARALAADAVPPQYRPDSVWSEGADIVWNGANGGGNHPAASPSLEGSQAEFADADEGYESESGPSFVADEGGDTTVTTVSAYESSQVKPRSALSPKFRAELQSPTFSSGGLRSPQTPSSVAFGEPTDPGSATTSTFGEVSHGMTAIPGMPFDQASVYGHARNSSVGSSVWAGRGARGDATAAPPLPGANGALSPLQPSFPSDVRASVAETSSLYSERHSLNLEDETSQSLDREVSRLEKEQRLAAARQESVADTLNDDRAHRPIRSAAAELPTKSALRSLPDGTKVPPMPPMPTADKEAQQMQNHQPRPRKSKTRRDHSPVLSYADGEAEEQRLEAERERDNGDARPGIRLTKNSPAPWELGGDDPALLRPSADLHGRDFLPSRPSLDNLLPTALKGSVMRARKGGMPVSPTSPTAPRPATDGRVPRHPLTTSKRSPAALSPEPDTCASPSSPALSYGWEAGPPMSPTSESEQPRSRSRSGTSGAHGVFKNMRIGSSGTSSSTSKKLTNGTPTNVGSSSRLVKAFRKASAPTIESCSEVPPLSPSPSAKLEGNTVAPITTPSTASPPTPARHITSPPSLATLSSSTAHRDKSIHSISSHSYESSEATKDSLLTSPQLQQIASQSSFEGGAPKKTPSIQRLAESAISTAVSRQPLVERKDGDVPNGPLMRTENQADDYGTAEKRFQKETHRVNKLARPTPSSALQSSPVSQRQDASDLSATDHASSSEQKNSPRLMSTGMAKLPGVGEHDGVPYKLISLEEARARQGAESRKGRHTFAAESTASTAQASYDKDNIEANVDSRRDGRLKTKKSAGFLRRLTNKDRLSSNPSREALVTTPQDPKAQSSLGAELQQLSVRPMSSMFSGLAPDFLDVMPNLDEHSEHIGEERRQEPPALMIQAADSERTIDMSVEEPSMMDTQTKDRISEIEAQMLELARELAQLRSGATTDDAIARELSQLCERCGCSCAGSGDRLAFEDASAQKGSGSILDRGRALKPIAGQNVGKFGGYLNR